MKISITVPCYNEEASIDQLVAEVARAVDGLDYELILVDDGSTDGTAEKLRRIGEQDPRVRPVFLRRNFGQTAAMQAGFDAAGGDIIVPMDADLQNDPADIPGLIRKLSEGYDVVSGWRKDRCDHWLRVIPSAIANRLISWISGVRLHDFGCSLKAYRRSILDTVNLYGEMHRFIPIYTHWNGARIAEVPVRHRPRQHGRSNYGFGRVLRVLLDLLVVKLLGSYSTKPIHLFGALGGVLAVVGTACVSWTAYCRFFEGIFVKDQPLFLVGIFLYLVAAQMTMLGLVAELIIRVYHESQQKRPYQLRLPRTDINVEEIERLLARTSAEVVE